MLLLCVLVVFSASSAMTARNVTATLTDNGSSSVAAAIMDAGRQAVSLWLYEKAELYFHMGKKPEVNRAFSANPFQNLSRSLDPVEHVHLNGETVAEILPWLWMAAKADPHNIQHYMVSSFWLAHEMGRPDLALDFLSEARCNNPFSYPIAMESGVIALNTGDKEEATSQLDAGLAFWLLSEEKASYDAKNDRARMLLYRALLYEDSGRKKDAVLMLEEILALFPARSEINKRISELKSGDAPSLLASSRWSDILHTEISERKDHKGCDYDDHATEDHAHDEHCQHEH